jgi:hypothetical protein
MLDNAPPGGAVPRAFLRIGGATIAQHQLGVARALGCQRLICLARATTPELIALQHDAEPAGMKFHILTDVRGLSALVTAKDELLVLSEGLLADPEVAAGQLGERPCVLVQGAEGAVEAGFERIDLNYASAGAILVPGNLVEHLHELAADCDVPSALTRIALQRGIRRHEVPSGLRTGPRWRMISNEAEAHATEDQWLRHTLGEARYHSPGFRVARAATLALGAPLLHSANGVSAVALSALALLPVALGVGWIGFSPVAFLLCALAWVLSEIHGTLATVGRKITRAPLPTTVRADALGWLCDLALVVLMTWEMRSAPSETVLGRLFAPLLLILLLRILPSLFTDRGAGVVRDRAILAVALAVAAASGIIPETVQLLALGLALAAIVLSARKRE